MPKLLSNICETLRSGQPKQDRNISMLLIDSRSLTFAEETLFFALTTTTNDGHNYIHDLYDKGVRAFCVNHIPHNMLEVTDADFIIVENVTDALQKVAIECRATYAGTMIGITGSRGKTTVKEWLYQLLSSDHDIARSPRSYNSQIGVPLSVWEIAPSTQIAIIEAGISRRGEMATLEEIIRPAIGIITNIAHEHDEGFSSMEGKCHEKVKLLRRCDTVIYNAGDEMIANEVEKQCKKSALMGWSLMENHVANIMAQIVDETEHSTIIEYTYQSRNGSFEIPFKSQVQIENAMHCLATMLALGISSEQIKRRMSTLAPVGTRMNVEEGVNNCMIIYDSYTSDLHSLEPAIDFMWRRRTGARSTTLILSDVMHESMPSTAIYPALAELLERRHIDRLIGIGSEFMEHSRFFPASASFYPDTDTFMAEVGPGDFDSELILIKGAPAYHFNLIADMLEARQHETVLEVNLDAMTHNFNFFRSRIKASTGIVCMVKASGYGAGSYELAKTLQSQGAAYLAVAVVDEGVDLRRAGITMPIMVLNPRAANYRTMFAYNLEPEIYSFDILHGIISEGEKYGITDYPMHIKIDSGMHRLGFIEQDMKELVQILQNQKIVRPTSIFSHLAAADDPTMDDYTLQQFEIFSSCADSLQSGFRYHIMRHILNSTGITRFPERQYDMVRLGICLYGIPTLDDGSQSGLRQVSSLTTSIISIKEWPAGTTIGYNRKGKLNRYSRIATIPVGYADGINRHLGNGGMRVYINGVYCPTVGNICMDACMIDVTDTQCEVGDRVEIFGPNIPVAEIAATLETIPYEVLTSVSTRVKRVYYRE